MPDIMITDPATFAYRYPTWASRISTEIDVALPGDGDSMPPVLHSDLSTVLKPIRVSRSAGGQQMDYADFLWMGTDPLIDRMVQPVRFSKMADVLFPDNPAVFVVSDEFWVYVGNKTRAILCDLNEEFEQVADTEQLTSRGEVRPYLFGLPFRGMRCRYNATATIMVVTGTDCEFNPMVDGVVRGNRSDVLDNTTYLWMDPEIQLSTWAAAFHGQTASEWTLFEAIRSICEACNADEWFIRNPALDIDDVFWTNAPVLRDIRIETGQYLPYYLDALLHPLGYNWWVNYDTTAVSTEDSLTYEKPIIEVFRKGYSLNAPKTLKYQRPKEQLDLSLSDVNQYAIRRRIGDATTAVRGLGDKLRCELTLPLYPGWAAAKDALTVAELTKTDGTEYEANPNVHRLWVANEGADYTLLRDDPDIYPIGDPPDLSAVFAICASADGTADATRYETKTVARRRMLEPPLTYQGVSTSKVRRELFLEFSTDAGATWVELTDQTGSWAVLGDQCGIIFTSNEPPSDIWDAFAGGDLRMRITGTIASDHSLYNVGDDDYTLGSVLGRYNLTTLRHPDRFRHWFVLGDHHTDRPELNGHALASVLLDDPAGADEHDDRAKLIQYCQDIIEPMLHAEIDGSFHIPGWTTTYQIGDLLSKIEGREITLNQASVGEQYCQITGIEWELGDDGPSTRITVDRGVREYAEGINGAQSQWLNIKVRDPNDASTAKRQGIGNNQNPMLGPVN